MNDRRAGALLLVAMVAVVYLPALSGGFVWDDDDHLTHNPHVAAPDGLRDIWTTLRASRYYPLTLTTFWAVRQLFGLHPLPYHVLNVVLHAANALMLWHVLRRLEVRGAWTAAALWALHPVMVESVAWITELKNTQSTFFLLAAVWCWLDDRRGRSGWAVAAFAAALASKPAVVMLPVVLLLADWWRRGRVNIWRTLPFFALSAAMALLTIIEQQHVILSDGAAEWRLSWGERCLLAGHAVWFYIGKLLWPADLTFVYPRWAQFSVWPLVAAVTAVAVCWRWRPVFFGVASFVALLVPVLGFWDIYYFRYSFVADHFNYLPSMALLALVPAVAGRVVRDRRGQRWLTASGLVALGVLTWQQTGIFHDSRTLWEDTLAKNPACWMAHNNLGTTLEREGRDREAMAHYRTALQLKPDYADPHSNLGNQLVRQGRLEEALTEYCTALRIQPQSSQARYNYAIALTKLGRMDDAIRQYEILLQINPHHADAHFNLGMALIQQNRYEAAAARFADAYRLGRDPAAAHNLALVLRKLGRTNEANRVRGN